MCMFKYLRVIFSYKVHQMKSVFLLPKTAGAFNGYEQGGVQIN